MVHYLIEFRFFGQAKHELKKFVWKVDRKFRLGYAKSHRPVPHITLVGPFFTRDEKRLISDFEKLCAKQPMMSFKIKGLGAFDDTRAVFIDVEPDETLDKFRWELSKKLKNYCNLSQYDLERKFHFHTTIAMKLSPYKFNLVRKSIEIEEGVGTKFYLMRVTLIKNQKILREYDFLLERLLSRREAKSRFILSETFKKLEERMPPSLPPRSISTPILAPVKELMGREFFIGDLHLNHENIIRYCHRPFRSVSGMNHTIVKRWNQTVGKYDTVLFLGDFVFEKRGWREKREVWAERVGEIARHWLRKLNGNIIFIQGNHDHYDSLPFHDSLVIERGGEKLLLIHKPWDAPIGWDGWIIHGHTHNNSPEYPLINTGKRTINVGAELLGYKPISMEGILGLIRGEVSSAHF